MEYLQIEGKKQRRSILCAGGSEVLRLSYPVVSGNTPAAMHTAALVKALVDYAEGEGVRIATAALAAAVKNGRLFAFNCHTFDVSLEIAHHSTHVTVTLELQFTDGNTPILSHKTALYWHKEECVQLPKAPRTRHKRRPRAAKADER